MARQVKRSEIIELIKRLGHDPEDVLSVHIHATCVSVVRLSRNRLGEVSMGVFGPVTLEAYHGIDEDVENVPEPTPDDAGT